jgi:phosphotriesterase-related protein
VNEPQALNQPPLERRLGLGGDREYDFGLAPNESFEPPDLTEEPFDPTEPHVMTALGPIAPEALGVCLVHEHLLARPAPIGAFDPDLVLDDPHAALAEVEALFNSGGRALLDSSTADYGRLLEDTLWVAARAPVHVILVTGHHNEAFALPTVTGKSIDDLAAAMVRDLTVGIDGTPARAGAIKAGSSLNAITPAEETVFRAAARAHFATGAPITTHTERGTMAIDQLRLLAAEGVAPSRVIVGHLDRRWDDDRALRTLLETGAFAAFDNVGKTRYGSDQDRAAAIKRLVDAGHADQLLLSGDMDRRSSLLAYGGNPGLGHVVERFPLTLMEAGLDAPTVRKLLVANPARALTTSRGSRVAGRETDE